MCFLINDIPPSPVILLLTKRNETFLSRIIFKLEIETSKNSVIYIIILLIP